MGEVFARFFYCLMIDKIKDIIEPVLRKENIELVDLIYRKEAGRQVLRLLVDKEDGIKLGDCVKLNEDISNILEEANIIPESYIVEVDSPGIGRWFGSKRDYERAKGRMVRVTLNERIMDKKEYIGRLEEVSENSVKIDVGKKKGIIEVPFDKIERARQEVEF